MPNKTWPARRRLAYPAVVLTIASALTAGCTGQTKRLDPDALSEQEVGTGLTSQDFRSVCERMARSLVQIPQIQRASKPPRVALQPVENRTDEYVDTDEFTHRMRTLLVKSAEGKIVFLDRAIASEIDAENRDKQRGRLTASGDEERSGADFFLTGQFGAIDKVAGAGATTYWRLSFRLTDAATSVIVWEDDYEIKKSSTVGDVYR